MIPRIQIQGSRLIAVPAVHYRAVFAEAVHRACRDEDLRPEAVAVELGPNAVRAAVSLLEDSGVGLNLAAPLPAMLGLVRRNRRIHPRFRPLALRLQQIHGMPLEELPESTLRDHLGFSGHRLLCLSSTDSIIEGIRSAIEMRLPVYGVDLDECANASRPVGFVEDPVRAAPDLGAYVERNAKLAAHGADPWVDHRREEVMAARLRFLLERHRTVLFTGGIGHWERLRHRLSHTEVRPASGVPPGDASCFLPVVVDPVLAIRQMDVFPEVTSRYEAMRGEALRSRDARSLYRDLMQGKLDLALEIAQPRERDGVAALAQYMAGLGLVGLHAVPHLADLVNAAEAMISRGFAERFGRELVVRSLRWATPEHWPQFPLLREVPPITLDARMSTSAPKACLVAPGVRSRAFYVEDFARGDQQPLGVSIPSPIAETDPGSAPDRDSRDRRWCWVWPPCEHLLYVTGFQAGEFATANARGRNAEPFSGSLHHGIDVKQTMRAFARNDRRVQVRIARPERGSGGGGDSFPDPVVFLLESPPAGASASWKLWFAGADLLPHVRDQERHREVVRREGSHFVASVSYSERRAPEEHLRPWVEETHHLWGAVVFGFPCSNSRQAALWVESGEYIRFPVLRGSGIENLCEHHRVRHGTDLDPRDWMATLLRVAVPYARQRVVVVARDSFPLSSAFRQEAARKRIVVEKVPLSHFSADRIAAIQSLHLTSNESQEAASCPKELEMALGQSSRAHFDLLPRGVRARLSAV